MVSELDARVRDGDFFTCIRNQIGCSYQIFSDLNWHGIFHRQLSVLDYVSCPRQPSQGQIPHAD